MDIAELRKVLEHPSVIQSGRDIVKQNLCKFFLVQYAGNKCVIGDSFSFEFEDIAEQEQHLSNAEYGTLSNAEYATIKRQVVNHAESNSKIADNLVKVASQSLPKDNADAESIVLIRWYGNIHHQSEKGSQREMVPPQIFDQSVWPEDYIMLNSCKKIFPKKTVFGVRALKKDTADHISILALEDVLFPAGSARELFQRISLAMLIHQRMLNERLIQSMPDQEKVKKLFNSLTTYSQRITAYRLDRGILDTVNRVYTSDRDLEQMMK